MEARVLKLAYDLKSKDVGYHFLWKLFYFLESFLSFTLVDVFTITYSCFENKAVLFVLVHATSIFNDYAS